MKKSSLFEWLEIEETANAFEGEFSQEELEDMGIIYKPWSKDDLLPVEMDLSEEPGEF